MCTHNLHKTSPNLGINDNNFGILFQINDCVPWTMNESSRGEAGGGDPPISGGFPPPPHPKEEFPTPPSSAQGQNSDLQLGAFGQDDLGESTSCSKSF